MTYPKEQHELILRFQKEEIRTSYGSQAEW